MSRLLYFLPVLCFWQLACFEPTEGCLDIEATNYEVSADDPCSDCCIFPSLIVDVNHVVNFTNPDTFFLLRYETLYPNLASPFGDSFLLDRARFLLSDFKLLKSTGEEVSVLDTIRVELPSGNPVTISDNFGKFDRDIFAPRTVGTILSSGIYTGVKFTLGLDEQLQAIEPNSVPSGHPLSTAADVLNYDTLSGNYIPFLLIYRQDTAAMFDSVFIQITEPDTVTLNFEAPFELARGFDVNLTLEMDYIKWFEGADLRSQDLGKIKTAIRQNLPNSISVLEISQ